MNDAEITVTVNAKVLVADWHDDAIGAARQLVTDALAPQVRSEYNWEGQFAILTAFEASAEGDRMRVFTVSNADIDRCPTHRLDVEHYREDGTGCKCWPVSYSAAEAIAESLRDVGSYWSIDWVGRPVQGGLGAMVVARSYTLGGVEWRRDITIDRAGEVIRDAEYDL